MVCGNGLHEHNHGPHGSSCVTPGIHIVKRQAADNEFLEKMLVKSAKPQVQKWGMANFEFVRATWIILIPLINGTYGWRADNKTKHETYGIILSRLIEKHVGAALISVFWESLYFNLKWAMRRLGRSEDGSPIENSYPGISQLRWIIGNWTCPSGTVAETEDQIRDWGDVPNYNSKNNWKNNMGNWNGQHPNNVVFGDDLPKTPQTFPPPNFVQQELLTFPVKER